MVIASASCTRRSANPQPRSRRLTPSGQWRRQHPFVLAIDRICSHNTRYSHSIAGVGSIRNREGVSIGLGTRSARTIGVRPSAAWSKRQSPDSRLPHRGGDDRDDHRFDGFVTLLRFGRIRVARDDNDLLKPRCCPRTAQITPLVRRGAEGRPPARPQSRSDLVPHRR